jgi:hypothetical protein
MAAKEMVALVCYSHAYECMYVWMSVSVYVTIHIHTCRHADMLHIYVDIYTQHESIYLSIYREREIMCTLFGMHALVLVFVLYCMLSIYVHIACCTSMHILPAVYLSMYVSHVVDLCIYMCVWYA